MIAVDVIVRMSRWGVTADLADLVAEVAFVGAGRVRRRFPSIMIEPMSSAPNRKRSDPV